MARPSAAPGTSNADLELWLGRSHEGVTARERARATRVFDGEPLYRCHGRLQLLRSEAAGAELRDDSAQERRWRRDDLDGGPSRTRGGHCLDERKRAEPIPACHRTRLRDRRWIGDARAGSDVVDSTEKDVADDDRSN